MPPLISFLLYPICLLYSMPVHHKCISRSEFSKCQHLLQVDPSLTAGFFFFSLLQWCKRTVPTYTSLQTAVQCSHFSPPMGSKTGANVVSLGTVSVCFSGYITKLPCQCCPVIWATSPPALKVQASQFFDKTKRRMCRMSDFNAETGQLLTTHVGRAKYSGMLCVWHSRWD